MKQYMGILFVLLIEGHTKFVGMMAMNQRCFLTASRRSCFLLHCLQDNPELPPQGQVQAEEEEETQEAQWDQEESEHLPGGVGEASRLSKSEDESIVLDVSNDEVIENREEEGGNPAAGSSRKKMRKNNDDPNGRMPGQLSSEAPPLVYHDKKEAAIAHIKTLISKNFTMKHKNKSMIWTVVVEWIP